MNRVWIAVCFGLVCCWIGSSSFGEVPQIGWKCSTESAPWIEEQAVNGVSHDLQPFGAFIAVDSKRRYQVIDGWGGCFNERGQQAMEILSEEERHAVMRSIFGCKEKNGWNLRSLPDCELVRVIMRYRFYSLDEVAGDYSIGAFQHQTGTGSD